jgi:hypothetical protein
VVDEGDVLDVVERPFSMPASASIAFELFGAGFGEVAERCFSSIS